MAMFAVEPKLDCPHVHSDNLLPPLSWLLQTDPIDTSSPCFRCQSLHENWICLGCKEVNCSRFILGHAIEHFNDSGHPLAISLSDLSVWCYSCESYVKHDLLKPAQNKCYISKFDELPPELSNIISNHSELLKTTREPNLRSLIDAISALPAAILPAEESKGDEPSDDSLECLICQQQMETSTSLVQIPRCSHIFHRSCISTWLLRQNGCPTCRGEVLDGWARTPIHHV